MGETSFEQQLKPQIGGTRRTRTETSQKPKADMVPVSNSPAKLRLVDVGLSKRQTLRGFWLYILDGHQETSVDHHVTIASSTVGHLGSQEAVIHESLTSKPRHITS